MNNETALRNAAMAEYRAANYKPREDGEPVESWFVRHRAYVDGYMAAAQDTLSDTLTTPTPRDT